MQESKLSVICEKVFNRCLAPSTGGGEGCDNMTMILVQFKKPVNSGASTRFWSTVQEWQKYRGESCKFSGYQREVIVK